MLCCIASMTRGPCGTFTLHVTTGTGIGAIPVAMSDLDGDRTSDTLDLLLVLAAWGATSGPEDINTDGMVDVLDLLALLAAWGPC